ncbi:MAG TPA: thioredoxin family protein [Victivallales bacterium]|nr:thioredoxin family protein [Victivallales bacterium]
MKKYKKLIIEAIVVILGVTLILTIIDPGKQCCPYAVKKSVEMSGSSPVIGKETKTELVSVVLSDSLGKSSPEKRSNKMPKIIDFGSTKCVNCKMMATVLGEIERDYKDFIIVEFIDVFESPSIGEKYKIEKIPTQIFFDLDGNELFRHEGFISKEDIMAKWQELGVKVSNDSEKK